MATSASLGKNRHPSIKRSGEINFNALLQEHVRSLRIKKAVLNMLAQQYCFHSKVSYVKLKR